MKRRSFFRTLAGLLLAPLGLKTRPKRFIGCDPASGWDTTVYAAWMPKKDLGWWLCRGWTLSDKNGKLLKDGYVLMELKPIYSETME